MEWWVVIPGALVGLGEALRRPRRWGIVIASAVGATGLALALRWYLWSVLGAGWPEVREAAEGPLGAVGISALVVALGAIDRRRLTSA